MDCFLLKTRQRAGAGLEFPLFYYEFAGYLPRGWFSPPARLLRLFSECAIMTRLSKPDKVSM
jgi:hypothetical protein